jgi:hypothetical protein
MKPKCNLIGENGNVFNLIAIVRRTLKEHKMDEELIRFDEDLKNIQQSGGTYGDVLVLFMEYVEVM